MDIKYVIFDCVEISKINFTEVMEASEDTLRRSLDGLQTFVKYEGDMPPSVQSLVSKSEEYYHLEIIPILKTPEWTNYDIS